ncbi:MAG: hypothetical protein JO022_19145 [Acidobacteriaceae bacterium]|nr:hypothetical protein [Acidobacteriaceae bacterium]
MKSLKQVHPSESQLALYSGHDLGFWEQRRIGKHVDSCQQCRQTILHFQTGTDELRDLASDMPADLNWARLSQEMTGNIRVGLAAGECIEGFERSLRPARPKLLWHTASVLGVATVVMVAAMWLNMPEPQREHLVSSLTSIRWSRIGSPVRSQPALAVQDSVVLEASPLAIEVKSNGRALSLMHPRSDGATVSINMDSAGVRYVDAETGQVTTNKVYYAE